jgi:hypothetical protein
VALRGFVARIQAITTDMIVSEQLIEVVAHIIERLPDEPLLALLLANDRTNLFSRRMLLPDEIARCRAILQHTHIDWAAWVTTRTRLMNSWSSSCASSTRW